MIVRNGRVFTGDRGLETPPVEAFSVAAGRFAVVGSDADVMATAGPGTEVVDLEGRMTMPGIADVHAHLMLGGAADAWELGIKPSDSLDDILASVRREASSAEAGEWIIGGIVGSLVMNQIDNGRHLRALDDASAGRPVMLRDDTQHNRWVNSAALQRMGVGADTPDLPGGTYVRDDSGALTGVLYELASRHAEEVATSQLRDLAHRKRVSARRAVEIMNSFGVTAVQEAATFRTALEAFHQLDHADELNAWIVASMPARDFVVDVGEVGDELFDLAEQFRSTHLRPDFVKAVVDGIPMSYTAALLEPYAGSHCHGKSYAGTSYFSMPELTALLENCHDRGLGCKLHATGDGAVRQILDAVDAVRGSRGPGPVIHIAHTEFVHPQDIPRFAALGVVADLSPAMWFPSPMSEAIRAVVPAAMMDRMWPFRDMLADNVMLAAGSDWPCAHPTPSPWVGLEAMITRADPSGEFAGTLNAGQSIALEAALQTYTSLPAAAMGLAAETGTITVGKSADFLVLDRDLMKVDSSSIHDTVVDRTVFAGRTVFSRS
ncbi:amidohydrolase [Rhodococcus sp. MEB064]|uniref:amidohydrolase n=1 Tax=Rhodococcus sp. MEB064 TaxID=1587522 RepID=UPI0018CE571F|nr:amidohydrolase [Rhodococcus sp. MEB064]